MSLSSGKGVHQQDYRFLVNFKALFRVVSLSHKLTSVHKHHKPQASQGFIFNLI